MQEQDNILGTYVSLNVESATLYTVWIIAYEDEQIVSEKSETIEVRSNKDASEVDVVSDVELTKLGAISVEYCWTS